MLVVPAIRKNEGTLALACIMLFISLWIDKSFGLIIGGFLVLTFLYKIAITVREQAVGVEIDH